MNVLHKCPPHLSDVATLPCEIQKSHFNSIIRSLNTLDYLRYLRRKQNATHLPIPPENVTTLTCAMQTFFIWLKVCCVLSNVGGFEKRQLWVGIGGCEKNRLWCVATGMSRKGCHSKCSEWPPSASIHASSLFRHCSVASCTTLCSNSARRNKPLLQLIRIADWFSIHALFL